MTSSNGPGSGIRRLGAPLLALMGGLLIAGFALGQVVPLKDWLVAASDPAEMTPEAWRAAFAADFALTTTQTLVTMPQDDRQTRLGLGVIGKRLGLDLDAGRLDLPRASLQRAGLFFFRNAFVGQVVWTDEENGAFALYMLKRDEPATAIATERRGSLNVAYWSAGGHAFMLTGVAPDSVLEELAGKLKGQLGG